MGSIGVYRVQGFIGFRIWAKGMEDWKNIETASVGVTIKKLRPLDQDRSK